MVAQERIPSLGYIDGVRNESEHGTTTAGGLRESRAFLVRDCLFGTLSKPHEVLFQRKRPGISPAVDVHYNVYQLHHLRPLLQLRFRTWVVE